MIVDCYVLLLKAVGVAICANILVSLFVSPLKVRDFLADFVGDGSAGWSQLFLGFVFIFFFGFPAWLFARAVVLHRIGLSQASDKARPSKSEASMPAGACLLGVVCLMGSALLVTTMYWDGRASDSLMSLLGLLAFAVGVACITYGLRRAVLYMALRPFGKPAPEATALEKADRDIADGIELVYLKKHPELKDKCAEYRDYFARREGTSAEAITPSKRG